MAGTLHGKKDVYVNTVGSNNAQEGFKSLFDFFEDLVDVHGYCTRVALNWGSGGTGTDFWDGANPFGSNAFAVYCFPPSPQRLWSWYILIQWSAGATFGSAPGNPGLTDGGTGGGVSNIAFAVAAALDSGDNPANPWNGTSNFDGADTKGATVWAAPGGGTLYVMPRSNDVGGSHATNKENCGPILLTGTTVDQRLHFAADEDSFWSTHDHDDANRFFHNWFVGPYVPTPDFNPAVPLVSFQGVVDPSDDVVLGDLTGVTGGGVVAHDSSQTYAFRAKLPRIYAVTQGTHGVSTLRGGGKEVLPIQIWLDEAGLNGTIGYIRAEDMAIVANATSRDVVPASGPPYTHLIAGETGDTSRWIFRYGANTLPNNTSTRTGEDY